MNYRKMFYYPIDLHYSQTGGSPGMHCRMFYYPIDLHYSQTPCLPQLPLFSVLLPYRFTLLSNLSANCIDGKKVLLPYRFTLLSNAFKGYKVVTEFYYPIDLHYSQTSNSRKRPAIVVKSIGII